MIAGGVHHGLLSSDRGLGVTRGLGVVRRRPDAPKTGRESAHGSGPGWPRKVA